MNTPIFQIIKGYVESNQSKGFDLNSILSLYLNDERGYKVENEVQKIKNIFPYPKNYMFIKKACMPHTF